MTTRTTTSRSEPIGWEPEPADERPEESTDQRSQHRDPGGDPRPGGRREHQEQHHQRDGNPQARDEVGDPRPGERRIGSGDAARSDLATADEPGEEAAPGAERDDGDGQAQDVRLGIAADHQQLQVDLDDRPAPGDEHEPNRLVQQPDREEPEHDGEDRVATAAEEVVAEPPLGVVHRSTSVIRRLATLTRAETTSEIMMYTTITRTKTGTAGEPLPTVVWATSVRS